VILQWLGVLFHIFASHLACKEVINILCQYIDAYIHSRRKNTVFTKIVPVLNMIGFNTDILREYIESGGEQMAAQMEVGVMVVNVGEREEGDYRESKTRRKGIQSG